MTFTVSRLGSSLSGDGMGLLDDAIREHLELKRQRGADLGEVERQEREALGAPRQAEFAAPAEQAGEPVAKAAQALDDGDEREPFDAEAVAPGDEVGAPSGGEPFDAGAVEPDDDIGAPSGGEPFDADAVEPRDEVAAPEPELPAPGAEAAAPGYDEDPWLEEERDEVPADESLDRPRDVGEEPGEDVLEDTPDFLQETPEHDRLWFEQRPPRDFDWDK